MLLVFDIGNSNIVMGAYEGKKLCYHWRISTDRQKTGDEYGMLINELFRFQGIKHHFIGCAAACHSAQQDVRTLL